jgi:hypothetical protein
MAGLNVATLLLAVVVVAALVSLLTLAAGSRRLATARADLLWAFLRRRGTRRAALVARAGERAVRVAEMRCAACSSRGECLALLAEGAASPAADCPNAALFERSTPSGGRP